MEMISVGGEVFLITIISDLGFFELGLEWGACMLKFNHFDVIDGLADAKIGMIFRQDEDGFLAVQNGELVADCIFVLQEDHAIAFGSYSFE